ncbi:MAG: hypothetical protein K6G52_06520 [Treponemataceae bacterium]|nr:hypothetical protein [Treponemataceae bacterium]
MDDQEVEPEIENFELSLTLEQAKELCLLLRKRQSGHSYFLNNLELKITDYLSDVMSIGEAEEFFNEN